MIAHILGKVVEKYGSSIIIDVHGVGYEVVVAAPDFDRIGIGEEVELKTYHHIREQSQELFGFANLSAKRLFELLITVQGVGPKAAMAIMSIGESEAVRSAIANSDVVFIAQAAGVGKKSAERVIVDLKDKVGLPDMSIQRNSFGKSGDEALEALMALGYSLNDASQALANVPQGLSTSERVTQALKSK
ncbi:MAG: Holliday junction branch migration protein RuvA [Candidatus Nomurabacteria bacterium]|jgi:Holliday junction DNA helicase RuvA|nr:Holliday junction branch migration protein RuvA [Candidatus Nomurabacteria bacterium]